MATRSIRALTAAFMLAVALIGSRAGATIIAGGNIVNQTWTPAGNPYIVQGDVIIPAGAFLTIQAGTIVRFASTDGQAAGLDTGRVEVTVRGTLTVSGTAASPVTFEADTGTAPNTWYGINVDTTATSASITNALIRHAGSALRNAASGSVLQVSSTRCTLSTNGLQAEAGNPILSRFTADNCTYGIRANGVAGVTLTNAHIHSNSFAGVSINSTAAITLINHCTLNNNGAYNLYVGSTGGDGSVTVRNSILVSASNGVFRQPGGGTVTVTYSDVWGNSTNYFTVSPGAGAISANPQLASPTDPRLAAGSACIDAGTASGASGEDLYGTARPSDGDGVGGAAYDIGAFEFVCAASSISAHPVPVTVQSGQPASFSVSASGTAPFAYQWRRNGVNLVDQSHISGVTTATLAIAGANAADAGAYDVLVTSACGSATSNAAALTVNPASTCGSADFDGDGDIGTDADIEAFFRVLAGGSC